MSRLKRRRRAAELLWRWYFEEFLPDENGLFEKTRDDLVIERFLAAACDEQALVDLFDAAVKEADRES